MKTLLTTEQTMEILRTTVPRLEELSEGVQEEHLATVTTHGWSVGQQMAHCRAVLTELAGTGR